MINKGTKVVIWACYGALGTGFFFSKYAAVVQPWRTLLPFAYTFLALLMAKTQALSLDPRIRAAFIGRRINFQEFAKFLGCILGAFLWIFLIALPFFGDTPDGPILVAVPFFIFLAAGLFFLSRSY